MQWDKLILAVGKWLPEWSQMKGRGLKERYMKQSCFRGEAIYYILMKD